MWLIIHLFVVTTTITTNTVFAKQITVEARGITTASLATATIFDATVLSQRPQYDVVGSVIDATELVSTLAVGCMPGSGSGENDCHLKDSATVINGPSTWSLTATYISHTVGEDYTLTADERCQIFGGYTSATCSLSYQQQATRSGEYSTTSATSGWVAITAADISFYCLTVTAGGDKLTASST